MALAEPPDASGSLADCPAEPLAGRTIYRVWRARTPDGTARSEPWWFATAAGRAGEGGRFDLVAPMGTCYLSAQRVGALLEALQGHLTSLPIEELRARRLARIVAPDDAPDAAKLTARRLGGRGVTAALWAGSDRSLTQRWAQAFRRDGWWALYAGLQHDPSGRLRGYALFDRAGSHTPTLGGPWRVNSSTLADDAAVHAELRRFGVTVREPGELRFVMPLDSE